MGVLLTEIRQACRSLWSQPAWTLAALLCLVIGTGANTAAFSVINGVLLRPLPFDEPRQIAMIAIRPGEDRQAGPVSLEQFREIRLAADPFQQLAVRTFLPVALAADWPARMVQAEFVSGGYFPLLRLRPLAGDLLGAESDWPGAGTQAVLTEKLWRTHFHSDPAVVGTTVQVNGRPTVVRGVAPPDFVGAMRIIAADLWLPASSYPSFASPEAPPEAESARVFGLIGRLKPGVSLLQATEQFDLALANRWRSAYGSDSAPASVLVEATGFGVPPGVRPAVVGGTSILFALMALLVAVAIANVAGLMLARATGRQKEIAVRQALGASPARIVRQVLTESLILASAGACLGGALAVALPSVVGILAPSLPEHLALAVDVAPDWRTALYAAISALGIAALFGLAPARHAAGTNANLSLRESSGNSRTRGASRMLNAFVTAQVAVSTVLLVIAVLLGRTYHNIQAVDPGIDIRNTLSVAVNRNQSGSDRNGAAFWEQLLNRGSSLPGVRSTALTQHTPLSPGGASATVSDETGATFLAGRTVVAGGYFDTVGLPLLQGRGFGPADAAAQPVAVVNETLARRLDPDGLPLGQRIALGKNPERRLEVIGVVRDAKYRSLSESPRPMFYEPLSQTDSAQMTLLLRVDGDPAALAEPVRREIQSLNLDNAVVTIRTLEDQFREAAAPSRQRAIVLSVICGIGLLLSAFGLFGVMSYGVRRQVRELGVRMALGARPSDIGIMVLRQALRLVGTGLGIGLIAAFGATQVIKSALFGVSAHDPLTLCLVAGLLGGVGAAAVYLPARWAMRVDPMLSIRADR